MPRFLASLSGVCLSAFSLACSHTRAVAPVAVEPPAWSNPRDQPRLLPRQPADEGEPITTFMHEHFQIATWARDSVIDGALERLRIPLQALSVYEYETVVPGGWMQGIARLQAAASLTANAETLAAAASGVAAMARVCGQCHRELGRSLPLAPSSVVTKTPSSDSLESRMTRHSWAAERLWEGLMAPSDDAWHAGAMALAHAPARAPDLPPNAPTTLARDFGVLREIGLRATTASAIDDRTNIYGQTLATCSRCHGELDEHTQGLRASD